MSDADIAAHILNIVDLLRRAGREDIAEELMARDFIMAHANWSLIPEHMRGGIERYVLLGMPPGGFLRAVICNDLFDAVGRADDFNIKLLGNYCKFFHGWAPHECWGSTEKYEKWTAQKGLSGQGAARLEDDE